jgi:hypothetical protein
MPERHSRPDRTVGTAGRGVRGRPGEEIVTGRSEFRSRARLTACKSGTRLTPTTTARRSAQPAASLWASPSTRTDQRDTSVSSAAFPTIRRRVPSCERPIFRRGVVRRSGVVSWDAHPAYVSVAVPTKDDAANRRGDGQSHARGGQRSAVRKSALCREQSDHALGSGPSPQRQARDSSPRAPRGRMRDSLPPLRQSNQRGSKWPRKSFSSVT